MIYLNNKRKFNTERNLGKIIEEVHVKKLATTGKKEDSILIKSIKKIIMLEENPPKKSIFKFKNTTEAAEFNAKILAACDYDYEKILTKQKGTIISYGSEFREVNKLSTLLKFHNNWERLREFLINGTDTSFSDISENTLRNDCIMNI